MHKIKCFMQGWLRYLFPIFVRKRIKKQIRARIDNPKTRACRLLGQCKNCGCKTPQVFYCDKPCNECYEEIHY